MIVSSLEQIRSRVRTGDTFAYGKRRGFGHWIEVFTDSDQCHVSTAVANRPLVQVAEAIAEGAHIRPVTLNWEKADDVWWLPLSRDVGTIACCEHLLAYLADITEREVPYDFWALNPRVWRHGRPPEDFSRLYCSELVALGLRHLAIYHGTVELTPIEVCRLGVYAPQYHCIKWDRDGPKEIEGYNSIDPAGDPFATMEPSF